MRAVVNVACGAPVVPSSRCWGRWRSASPAAAPTPPASAIPTPVPMRRAKRCARRGDRLGAAGADQATSRRSRCRRLRAQAAPATVASTGVSGGGHGHGLVHAIVHPAPAPAPVHAAPPPPLPRRPRRGDRLGPASAATRLELGRRHRHHGRIRARPPTASRRQYRRAGERHHAGEQPEQPGDHPVRASGSSFRSTTMTTRSRQHRAPPAPHHGHAVRLAPASPAAAPPMSTSWRRARR